MMTPTAQVLARYKVTKEFTDKLGRTFRMRVLRPSENMTVMRLISSDVQTVVSNYLIAASICGLPAENGLIATVSFPSTLAELNFNLDRLGREGMRAAVPAYVELNREEEDEEPEAREQALA